jgi:hypothetical protein
MGEELVTKIAVVLALFDVLLLLLSLASCLTDFARTTFMGLQSVSGVMRNACRSFLCLCRCDATFDSWTHGQTKTGAMEMRGCLTVQRWTSVSKVS